ncbi:MAG: CCA tRNA nucleotidyltransferase [Bacilli bacterium]|nr:CCA tRNA nucleotidyltransferase [Bacilli bacterium]
MLNDALKLITMITDSGFDAYIVGGFVRDYIMGIESNDIDVTTNAKPKDLREIFKDSVSPQEDYGSVTVMFNNVRYEITTYRKEIGYISNRKPDRIEYIDDLYEDIIRRDFTVNSLCMDNKGNIIDLLGSRKDIENKVIKCIGDPDHKFSEDAFRILRAIRFATVLDFDIEENTSKAINNQKHLLKNLSYYRKKEELDKIFTSKNVCRGVRLLLKYGLDKELEIENLKDVKSANNLIGVWTVLKVEDKYPFTSNEKSLIKNINTVLDKNNLDPYNLYKYGLYVNSVAGEIKGIDLKEISSRYQNLPIRSRKELDITAQDIIDMMGKEPGSYINEILGDIEYNVLYRKLKNNKEDICKYIEKKYK